MGLLTPSSSVRTHARVAVRIDLEERWIAGVAELLVTPSAPKFIEENWVFSLHCSDGELEGSGLSVSQVTVNQQTCTFEVLSTEPSREHVSHDGAHPAQLALRNASEASDEGCLRISAPRSMLQTVHLQIFHGASTTPFLFLLVSYSQPFSS